jgi:hypothetical protein
LFPLCAALFGICSLKFFVLCLVCLRLSLIILVYLASDFECHKFILYDHKLMMVCAWIPVRCPGFKTLFEVWPSWLRCFMCFVVPLVNFTVGHDMCPLVSCI